MALDELNGENKNQIILGGRRPLGFGSARNRSPNHQTFGCRRGERRGTKKGASLRRQGNVKTQPSASGRGNLTEEMTAQSQTIESIDFIGRRGPLSVLLKIRC